MAVVSDKAWVRHSVNAFAWMMPARIRVYPDTEQSDALAWVNDEAHYDLRLRGIHAVVCDEGEIRLSDPIEVIA